MRQRGRHLECDRALRPASENAVANDSAGGPATFVFSCLGAVAWLPEDAIRPLILLLLIVAAVYALKHKYFGPMHRQFAWSILLLFY